MGGYSAGKTPIGRFIPFNPRDGKELAFLGLPRGFGVWLEEEKRAKMKLDVELFFK